MARFFNDPCTYGTEDKNKAEQLARYLSARYSQNLYSVSVYDGDYPHPFWPADQIRRHVRRIKWGVVRMIPYCEQMPWRNDGFVWHDYTRPLPSLGLLG